MKPVRRPVLIFTLSTLAVVLAVTAVTVTAALWVARTQAEHDVHRMAEYFTNVVVAPLSIAELSPTGDSDARQRLDNAVAELLDEDDVYRVKLWTIEADDTAQIVYSDLREIEGLRVPVSPVLNRALTTSAPTMIPVPEDFPHRTEQREHAEVVEVYLPYRDADGSLAVAELYLEIDTDAHMREVLAHWLPITVGGPVLLASLTFPLSLRLARNHAAAEARRRELAEEALTASDNERRRLARLLHDGPVQALTALGMAIDFQARRQNQASASTSERESGIAEQIRGQVSQLRNLLDDLNPVGVDTEDMRAALLAVADSVPGHRARVEVTGSSLRGLSPALHGTLFRSGSELLRNALVHAHADTVTVGLEDDGSHVELRVHDDGTGFDPAQSPAGHHGLKLVRAAAESIGGSLTIESDATGTTAVIRSPRSPRRTDSPPLLPGR